MTVWKKNCPHFGFETNVFHGCAIWGGFKVIQLSDMTVQF